MKKSAYYVMGAALLVVVALIAGTMAGAQNYDNERVAGEWAGTTVAPEYAIVDVDVVCDGQGGWSGNITRAGTAYGAEGTYQLLGEDFQGILETGGEIAIVFTGTLAENFISGDAAYIDAEGDHEATFTLVEQSV